MITLFLYFHFADSRKNFPVKLEGTITRTIEKKITDEKTGPAMIEIGVTTREKSGENITIKKIEKTMTVIALKNGNQIITERMMLEEKDPMLEMTIRYFLCHKPQIYCSPH